MSQETIPTPGICSPAILSTAPSRGPPPGLEIFTDQEVEAIHLEAFGPGSRVDSKERFWGRILPL